MYVRTDERTENCISITLWVHQLFESGSNTIKSSHYSTCMLRSTFKLFYYIVYRYPSEESFD